MRKPVALSVVFVACAVVPAFGDYWTQYQSRPDAPYPEDQGWQRIIAPGYGGAQRSIDEDGNLVLDSSGSGGIVDSYRIDAPGMFHADWSHPFVIEWREKVDFTTDPSESDVGLFSDDGWGAGFSITSDRIYSVNEYPASASFAPGWHNFRMTTEDMRSWALSIDNTPALEGSFIESYWASGVGWGDGGQGGVSLTRWAYFGFGIVPEPTTILELSVGLALVLRMSRGQRAGSVTFGGVS
jgi:hypothetical protein